jgi:histone H3/H4
MNILNSKSIDKGNSPKDITIIRKIFSSLGIEEYEKNTLNYMSEFINSYVIDILKEAKKNMILAKREKINIEDVESAVSSKQNHMYKNRTTVQEMKLLADKINSIELPKIPESSTVLRPPIENNLLRNNFQIYSDELNQALLENKNLMENTSLRVDDLTLLGNKRKVNFNFSNESRNNLNSSGKIQKNKRKISLNQAFKKTSQENAKKEGINLIENDNNIKINFAEPKKIVNIKSNNLNSINNNEDDNDFDNDEVDNTNNQNIGESTLNKKEEEEEEIGDDDAEGEELEGDEDEGINETNNNNDGNESVSRKEDKDKNDSQLDFIHGDNNDEENFDEDS